MDYWLQACCWLHPNIIVQAGLTIGMIKYDIHNNRYAIFMALINKLSKRCFCAVIFIRGKIETGIVAPTAVPFKLVKRHYLNRINTKAFQVTQSVFYCLPAMR